MGRNPLFRLWAMFNSFFVCLPSTRGCHISPVWSWWLVMTGPTDAGKGPRRSSMACLWHTQICVFPRLNALYRAISIAYINIYIYIYLICVCVSYIPRNPNTFHATSVMFQFSYSVFRNSRVGFASARWVTCAAGAAARSQLPAADSQGVETARALAWSNGRGWFKGTQGTGGSYGWIMDRIILITIDN